MSRQVPEDVKKEIRAILLSKVGGIQLSQFIKDFTKLTGHRIEYRVLGFHNLDELFQAIPDVAKVLTEPTTQEQRVYGVTSDSLAYVNATALKAQYVEGEKPASEPRRKGRSKSPGVFSVQKEPKMDGKKQGPMTKHELDEVLVPNIKGLYALCIPRKQFMTRDTSTEELINQHFSTFGELVETSFTERFIFVRFDSKDVAVDAYTGSQAEYDCRIPFEKNEPKKVIKDRDHFQPPAQKNNHPQTILEHASGKSAKDLEVFLGNLPLDIGEGELQQKVLEGVEYTSLTIKSGADKRFAFVEVKTKLDLAKLLSKSNTVMIRGKKVIIQPSYKDGGVTPRTDNDESFLRTFTRSAGKNDENQNDITGHLTNGLQNLSIHTQDRQKFESPESFSVIPSGRGRGTPRPTVKDFVENDEPPPLEDSYDAYLDDGASIESHGSGRGMGRGYHGNVRRFAGGPQVGGYQMQQPNKFSINFVADPGHRTHDFYELFVTNFIFFTEAEDLLAVFAEYGASGIKMLNTNDTSKCTRAFIQFPDHEKAVIAMTQLDQCIFDGRTLNVNFAYNSFAPSDVVERRLKSIKCVINISGQDDSKRTVMLEGEDQPRERVFFPYRNPSKAQQAPRPCLETTIPVKHNQRFVEEAYDQEPYEEYDEYGNEYTGEYYEGYEDGEYYEEEYEVQDPSLYRTHVNDYYARPVEGVYRGYRARGHHPGYQGGPPMGGPPRGGYHPRQPHYPGQFVRPRGPHISPHQYRHGNPHYHPRHRFAPPGQPYLLENPGNEQKAPRHHSGHSHGRTTPDLMTLKVEKSKVSNGPEDRPPPLDNTDVDYSDMPPLESEDDPPEQQAQGPPRNVVLRNRGQDLAHSQPEKSSHKPQVNKTPQNGNMQQREPMPSANKPQQKDGNTPPSKAPPGEKHQQQKPVGTGGGASQQKSPGQPSQKQNRSPGGNSKNQPAREMHRQNAPNPVATNRPEPAPQPSQKQSVPAKSRAVDTPLTMQIDTLKLMIAATCPQIGLVTTNDLPVETDIDLLVVHVMDKKHFWAQIILPGFMEGIAELGDMSKKLTAEKLTALGVNGQRGARVFEGEWARVWVMQAKDGMAAVFYVDYGNHETVELSSIMELPDVYWTLPPQAVPFRLKDPENSAVTVYTANRVTVLPCPDDQTTLIEVTTAN